MAMELPIIMRAAALASGAVTWPVGVYMGEVWRYQARRVLLETDFEDLAESKRPRSFGQVWKVVRDICPGAIERRRGWAGVCDEPYLAIREDAIDQVLETLKRRMWGYETLSGTRVG